MIGCGCYRADLLCVQNMAAQKKVTKKSVDMRQLIGRNLVELRISKHGAQDIKKQQYEIAKKIGLSGSQYQKYEQGSTGYYIDKLDDIAGYFDVSLAWLVTNHASDTAGFQEEAEKYNHARTDSQNITLEIIQLFQKIPNQSARNALLKILKDIKF